MDKFLPDEVMISERFLVDELKQDKTANILHFKPLENGRDEFGNRVFSSPLSYIDRESNNVKAALLVSPDGEAFIRENKGLLKDIDKGINFFSNKIHANGKGKIEYLRIIDKTLSQKIDLSINRTLTLKDAGGQSLVFLLEIGDSTDSTVTKKYIIKTNTNLSAVHTEFNQPYINEMLQVQTIDKVLGKDLKKLNISVSKFLFASGHVSCSEYAEGSDHPGLINYDENIKLNRRLINFIDGVHKDRDPLWKNVDFDAYDNQRYLPTSNMVKTNNGIVWVDPVYHYREMDMQRS